MGRFIVQKVKKLLLYTDYNCRACIYDYIEISFGDFQWKYCGNGSTVFIPDHFISSGSSMTIKFHSDRLGTKPGFFATWEEVQGMYSIKS